jgi:hypothetical protein
MAKPLAMAQEVITCDICDNSAQQFCKNCEEILCMECMFSFHKDHEAEDQEENERN